MNNVIRSLTGRTPTGRHRRNRTRRAAHTFVAALAVATLVFTGLSLPPVTAFAEQIDGGPSETTTLVADRAAEHLAEGEDAPAGAPSEAANESAAAPEQPAPSAEPSAEPSTAPPVDVAPPAAAPLRAAGVVAPLAVGDIAATVEFVNNPAGAPIDELIGSFDSRADAQLRLFGLRVGYSCGPSSCENAQVTIDPLALDPHYGQYRFAAYSSVTLPAGATFSGSAATGFTVKLGTLSPGTSGTFVMLFDYQARGVGVSAQSFFPDGAVIPATATISASNQTAFSTSDSVVWHIATPDPGVAFAATAVARVDQDYTYTDYMSAGCQWSRTTAGHGEPVYECAAGYEVRHTIPAGAVFVSASNGGSYDAATGVVTWTGSGASAAPGWGLLNNLGTPRTVTVRFPAAIVTDPGNCIIDVTNSITADVSYLSGVTTSASDTRTHQVNACVPFSSGSAAKFSSRNLGTASDPIVWATMDNTWTVRVSNRSNVPAVATVVDNSLDQAGLPVRRITTTGGPGAITATLDNDTVVQVSSSDYTAPAGRRIVAATVVTSPILGPNTVVTNQDLVTTADVRFHYTVEANVPTAGYERSNTASVTMDFPGTPELAMRDLGSATETVQVYRRPATLSPAISATVAGGGNPVAGTIVNYTMRGASTNMEANAGYQPQYVFVAPAQWTIVAGSAAIPGLSDASFIYKTVTVNGESRQAVYASRPAGTVWGVNEVWPAMSVKATPSASAAASSVGVAQFYQGDAGHNFGPTTAIWGATAGTTFGAYRYEDAADLDGDSDRTENYAYAVANLTIGASAQLSVLKEICSPDVTQPDGCSWLSNPDERVGVAPDAASIAYRVTITNGGSTALNNVVGYDVLPYPGDTGTSQSSASAPRGSTFGEKLNAITANNGLTLSYSTSTNPARPEVHPSSGGVSDWSGTAANAQSIRAVVAGSLPAGQSRSFSYVASIVGTPLAGDLACNSVAVASQSTPIVEPRAVCAAVEEADLEADGPATAEAQLGRPAVLPFSFANLGGSQQAAAIVTVDVPVGVTVTNFAPAGWSCTVSAGTPAPLVGPGELRCSPAAPLIKAEPVALALPVIVTASNVSVTAGIDGALHDSDSDNNEHTISIEVAAAASDIALLKSDGVSAVVVGQELDYTITVGNPLDFEALAGVTVTDTLPAGVEFVSASEGGVFADGVVTWTIDAIGAAAQTDVSLRVLVLDSAGSEIVNTARVSAADPGFAGQTLTGSATDTDLVDRITLSKTGVLAQPAAPRPGDVVTYTFVVRNAGGGALSGVTITDPMVGLSAITVASWPTLPGYLGAGQSVTATASYVLSQADVDAGLVTNTATAAAFSGGGGAVAATASDERALPGRAALTLQKVGALSVATPRVGDVIGFEFTVQNSGTVTVDNIAIGDALPGLSAITFGTWPGEAGRLAAGESVTASASYPVTQGDLNSGSVVNAATASGEGANGAAASASDEVTVLLPIAPALSLSKTGAASDPAGTSAGDTITYTFTVQNTGNVTATDVVITDPLDGLSAIAFGAWPGTSGVLEPGQSVAASAAYITTQADVDAGRVNNSASVDGRGPGGLPMGAIDSTTVSIPADPSIALVKTGLSGTAVPMPGDTVSYTFVVQNTGSITVHDVAITDPLDGLGAITFGEWPGADGVLLPSESVEATASYVLSQADIDRGRLDNTATASAEAANGAALEALDGSTVSLSSAPALSLVKSGSIVGTPSLGDAASFSFVIENTGNVTLGDVALVDDLDGLGTIAFGSWPGAPSVLKPGERVTATADYPINQADLDAGFVLNQATASAAGARGGTPSAQAEATVALPAAPALELDKSASLDAAAAPVAGDEISYTFEVSNTGNVTVAGIALLDGMPGLSGITFGTWPGDSGALAPGETVIATASYPLSQADLDAGAVYNSASLTGVAARGGGVGDSADVTTTLSAAPALAFEKSGAVADPLRPLAGQPVLFSFVIENTGNVSLAGVAITDELAGLGEVTFGAWPDAVGVLEPGQRVTATADYTLGQSDIDTGVVVNAAEANALPVRGDAITAPATTTVPLAAVPALAIVKTAKLSDANGDGLANPGERISYSFEVSNTGNVTLGDVIVNDQKVTGIPDIGRLAPGEAVTVAATWYIVLAADAEAGQVVNVATASGSTPSGDPVVSEESTVTMAAAAPIDPPVPGVPSTPGTVSPPPASDTPDVPAAGLASTGFAVEGIALIAGMLLIAGVFIMVFTIRRRSTRGRG